MMEGGATYRKVGDGETVVRDYNGSKVTFTPTERFLRDCNQTKVILKVSGQFPKEKGLWYEQPGSNNLTNSQKQ